MKNLLLVIALVLFYSSYSQEYATQLDYFPSQRKEIADSAYRRGIWILEQVYSSIKKNKFQVSYADHLNIGRSFKYLGEPKENILSEIQFAQKKNLKKTAEIFVAFYNTPDKFNLTKNEFDSLMKIYQPVYDHIQEEKGEVNLLQYAEDNRYSLELLKLFILIRKNDQIYRSKGSDYYFNNVEEQTKIDNLNMTRIDSLFKKYGTYIGKSMVGEKYEHVMWTVIQHSVLEKQEEYLPIVQKAVESNELKEAPFKMLIDRIYTKKYGYQIFGSQVGVDLASDEEIERVRTKYRIN